MRLQYFLAAFDMLKKTIRKIRSLERVCGIEKDENAGGGKRLKPVAASSEPEPRPHAKAARFRRILNCRAFHGKAPHSR